MTQDGDAGKGPDFESPALGMAAKVALEPSEDAKKQFETGLTGRFLAQATLLVKSVAAYLVAVGALSGVAWWYQSENLRYLLGSEAHWPRLVLIGLPLLIVGIPLGLEVSERRRRKQLEALAVSSDQYKPGFFRLEPYEEADAATFKRSDAAHEKVLRWLLDTQLPAFRYLTGASGAGKTSLLQAHVLPGLRMQGWLTLKVRALEDGVARVREALLQEGVVWRNPPDIAEPRELLEKAVAVLQRAGKRLLLVVDQFEEVYILESEASLGRIEPERAKRDAAAREVFLKLLRGLGEKPIEGMVVLLSLRKDYEDMVIEHYGLPPFRQNENWRSIGLFDVPAAMTFLRASGASASDEVLRSILTGAGKVEDREGLFRPVLLNLIGLQLVRSQGRLPCPPEKLVGHYLLASLSSRNVRDVAQKLFSPLVSDQGTALAKPLGELARAVGKKEPEVKGILRSLRDDGLVRPLDQNGESWQIAHDFLARQIGLLLGRLRRSAWQTAALWAAPVLLLGLVGALLAVPWWSRVQAHAELREMGCPANGPANEIEIFCFGSDLSRMAAPAGVVGVKSLATKWFFSKDLKAIRSLTTLTSLDIKDANIESLEPLRELTALTSLKLTRVEVSSLEPIRELTALASLELTGTKVSSLEPLRELTALTSLELAGTEVSSIEPLRGLTALTKLGLGKTKVENLEPLRGLTALTSLGLGSTMVESLEPLRGFTALTWLDLSYTRVRSLEPIRGLPALVGLELAGTQIDSLEPLADLASLKSLGLGEARVNKEDLDRLRGSNKDLAIWD